MKMSLESTPTNNNKNVEDKNRKSRRAFIKGLGATLAGAYLYTKGVDVFSEEKEDFTKVEILDFLETKQKGIRENAHELSPSKRHLLRKKPQFEEAQERVSFRIEHLSIAGKAYEFGVKGKTERESYLGRFQRALRFKEMSDVVEDNYELPRGILLAMIIQETGGRDVLPNALQDGGAGLIHMQPAVAREFGLTHIIGDGMVDRKAGRRIAELIHEKRENPVALAHIDERFHALKNIDAAGRMLAYHIHGRRITLKNGKTLGRMRTAIMRYAGAKNYEKYWTQLKRYMRLLQDPIFMQEVEDDFNARNPHMAIDGDTPHNPFRSYLKTFWKANAENYGLVTYLQENPSYHSPLTQEIRETIGNFLPQENYLPRD